MNENFIEHKIRKNLQYRARLDIIWISINCASLILIWNNVLPFPTIPCVFPILVVFLCAVIFDFGFALDQMKHIERHSIFTYLKNVGNVESLIGSINYEINNILYDNDKILLDGSFGRERGHLSITENWLCVYSTSELKLVYLRDIVQTYARHYRTTTSSGNIFVILDRYGRKTSFLVSNTDEYILSEIAGGIQKFAPNIVPN